MDDLPTKWESQHPSTEVTMSENGSVLKRVSDDNSLVVYANKSVGASNPCYFEVELTEGNNAIALGLSLGNT